MIVNPQFKLAATDPTRARTMLNVLHQKVLMSQDPQAQANLLGEYIALVLAIKMESRQKMLSQLSDILKRASETAASITSNMK